MCCYVRVTSHTDPVGLCLHNQRWTVHDGTMSTTQPIYRHTCHKCQRPALTFDKTGKSLCGDHAVVFIAAARVETKEDDLW
jgi:hypothetical protein